MIWFYLIAIIAFIVALIYATAFINRVVHAVLKWHGVTELTAKQRRGMASKYKETTGSGAPKKRRRVRKGL